MEGKNLEQTFFSLESSRGYQMQADCKSNSGSTLVARQSGGGGSYGSTASAFSGVADTTITFTNAAHDSEDTGETRLLSDKIREKKQGMNAIAPVSFTGELGDLAGILGM